MVWLCVDDLHPGCERGGRPCTCATVSPFNGGEQGRRLKGIDRCDIERRILTGGRWMGRDFLPTINRLFSFFGSSIIVSFLVFDSTIFFLFFFFYETIDSRNRVQTFVKRRWLANRAIEREDTLGNFHELARIEENLNTNSK